MNKSIFDKKIHMGRRSFKIRQAAAGALTAAMLLGGMLPMALAVQDSSWVYKKAEEGEKPQITIESNAVISDLGDLTGYLEVAVKVKTPTLCYDAAGQPVAADDPARDPSKDAPQGFRYVGAALAYNSAILTPVNWTDAEGETTDVAIGGDDSTWGIPTTPDNFGIQVNFPALKLHTEVSAIANVSGPAETDGGVDDKGDPIVIPPVVGGYPNGLFYIVAESTKPIYFEEETVVAVVRFRYDKEVYQPWLQSSVLGYDPDMWTDPQWSNPAAPGVENDKWLIRPAPDSVMGTGSGTSFVGQQVLYRSEVNVSTGVGRTNAFYYTDVTPPEDSQGITYNVGDAANPDYTSNLLTMSNHQADLEGYELRFTLKNLPTYDPNNRSNSTIILYYDYTNKLIGVQSVLPGDAREAVNAYVEKNFIHPDLRFSDHKGAADQADYTDSLLREHTYRGEYPYDAPVPIPDVASDTYEADKAAYEAQIAGKTAADGAEYPLTNKLDYVFYKRYTAMSQTVTDPDGVPNSGDETYTDSKTLVSDPDGIPDSGDEVYHIDQYDAKLLGGLTAADVPEEELLELPYIYGWAVVEDLDDIANVWTTLGTAEHTPYSGMDTGNGNAPMDTTVDTTGTGACLQFADFSDLQNGQVLYVKAVYEPGPELKPDEYYNAITQPAYERYGNIDTSAGGVYAISYTYARINADGQGVSRMRDPSVRIDYTPDVEGNPQKPFSVGLDLENYDTLPVTYTPSSALMSLEYSLRDKRVYDTQRQAPEAVMVDYNFYTGSARSRHGNFNEIIKNFNYEEHPYSEHLGSMGFVTLSTLNQLDKICREAVKTGVKTDVNAYVNVGMLTDLNWKAGVDSDGKTELEFETWQTEEFIAKLIDAYRIAGDAPLDWHQLQYHLINSVYDWNGGVTGGLINSGGTVLPAAESLAYNWCRIDDCSGGSAPITNWAELMAAAADYAFNSNNNALNQLQEVFHLRQDQTATPFADKEAMKAELTTVVIALKNQGVTKTEVEALTWKQVQYLMDEGTTGITTGNIPADTVIDGTYQKDYWWENGGTKAIRTWQELLEIQYHIENDNYFAGDGTTPGWRSEYTLNDALTGRVRDKDNNGNWLPNTFTTKAVALRKNAAGAEFDNETQFLAALNLALLALDNDYPNGNFTDISLMEIQHVLLSGNSYRTEADLMNDTVAGSINYWWITGASTPTDLESLVRLVQQVLDGAPEDMLDNVTVKLVSPGPFWLRADGDGTVFPDDATLRAQLKTAVQAWLDAGNDPDTADWTQRQTWSQIQNLMLGNAYAPDPDPGPSYDYWWYQDGHRPIKNLTELLEAAWNTWGGPGGTAPSDSSDPNAMDALTDLEFITGLEQTDPPSVDTSLYVYFRKDTDGNAFDSIDDFKAAMKTAIEKIAARDPSKEYATGQDWIVVQHLLLGNSYRTENQLRGDAAIDYWWEDGGSKPDPGLNIDYSWADGVLEEVSRKASDVYNSIASEADLIALLTDTKARALNLLLSTGGAPMGKEDIAQKVLDAVTEFYDNYAYSGNEWDSNLYDMNNDQLALDWRSLQNWILTGDELDLSNTQYQDMKDNYGVEWYPSASEEGGISFTAADAYVKDISVLASQGYVGNGAADASDVLASLTDQYAADLAMRDAGGSVCDAATLAQLVADAVNDYYDNNQWSGNEWDSDLYNMDDDQLELDWKSLQYWIISNDELNLRDKTYEEMKTNYGIDWYPINDVPTGGAYALRAPMRAPKPVESTEVVETYTTPDGLRTVTTTTRTTIDPNTGITEIWEERVTELKVGDQIIRTTDVTTTVIDLAAGTRESHTEYGEPIFVDAAAQPVVPEEKPEDMAPLPGETEEGDKADGETETPEAPDKAPEENGEDPDGTETVPEETNKPAEPTEKPGESSGEGETDPGEPEEGTQSPDEGKEDSTDGAQEGAAPPEESAPPAEDNRDQDGGRWEPPEAPPPQSIENEVRTNMNVSAAIERKQVLASRLRSRRIWEGWAYMGISLSREGPPERIRFIYEPQHRNILTTGRTII